MFQELKLLLPALIPSWRFFDVIAPSPRIEFTLLKSAQDSSENWQEFRPRPTNLKIAVILKRIFWNPHWNESLFLVSCAERLMQNPTQHSQREISNRINNWLQHLAIDITVTPYFQFRLVFLTKDKTQIQRHITYISKPQQIFRNNEYNINES